MKSTDSGVNWNQIQIPLYNFEIPDFYKETFIGNYGWVVGYYNDNGGPLTWRTTNFGTSWDTIGRVPYPPIIGNYCVYFSSLNTGWCGGESGYIFKTTNGGFNWFRQQTPSSNFRRSMYFYNDSIGWAVGGGGQILFTTTSGQWVDVKNISSEIPKKYKLYQNYPNPFNSKTIIDYELPVTDFVFLTINDVLGKQIIILKNRTQNAGKYRVEWDATNFSSGIYYCTFFTNSYRETRKIVLIK